MANTLPPVSTSVPAGAKPVRPARPLTLGRLVLYVVGVALVAGLLGYFFGWYRAYPAEQQRDRAMVRLRLSEARARALEGSVAIYRTNWGDAGQHMQEGVRLLEAFKAGEQQWLSPEHSARVDEAATLMQTARDLAAQASLDASGRAERAAALLGEVYRATPEP
jgi:hypothetical protein